MAFSYDYPRPCVTVDCVVLRSTQNGFEILLIQRGQQPYQGMWAFPGGFINMDEDLVESAHRELYEETNISGVALTQFKAYGAVHRDPRHRTITVVFTALIPNGVHCKAVAGDDARMAAWFQLAQLPELAFDHGQILNDVLRHLRISY